jgi:hypothetical protein
VQPEKAPKSDYILGVWAREDFVSPVADEVKLQRLCCNAGIKYSGMVVRKC